MRDKIKKREELAKLCSQFREQNKKTGFTSGVFDLVHAGHVDYLEKAKKVCDILIVGVNSDVSVKKFKGDVRPVMPEGQRAVVVAALESVDYVFVFDERRNRKNIEELKPDYYIKAADYGMSELSSAEVAREFGGETRLIEKAFDLSTTRIIGKIVGLHSKVIEKDKAVSFKHEYRQVSPAVFLDRDGTVNVETDYLHDPGKFEFLTNAVSGVKKMQEMGCRIVIVTTQAGIGLGYFSEEDFYSVNRKMLEGFSKESVNISKIYFCPHSKADGCGCRKPETGLVDRACYDLNLDLQKSFFVGDRTSDIETGKRVGARTILVRTGRGGTDLEFDVKPDYVADDLIDAAAYMQRCISTD